MTVRERVARTWHAGSDHAAESPFGGPLCNCWQVAERIMPMLREAWDEGNAAHRLRGHSRAHNPYEEDRHADR